MKPLFITRIAAFLFTQTRTKKFGIMNATHTREILSPLKSVCQSIG